PRSRLRSPHFFFSLIRPPPRSPLFPYTTLFRSTPRRPAFTLFQLLLVLALLALLFALFLPLIAKARQVALRARKLSNLQQMALRSEERRVGKEGNEGGATRAAA